MLMTDNPYPTFAFTQTFKTMEDCLAMKEATIESIENKKEAEQRLGCMIVIDPKSYKKGDKA